MAAREDGADCVYLIGQDRKFNRLIILCGPKVEVEQIRRLRQPKTVGEVTASANDQSVLMKGAGYGIPTDRGKCGLLPIFLCTEASQGFLDVRCCTLRRGNPRDFNFFVGDPETDSDMIAVKQVCRSRERDRAAGRARCQ